VWHVGKVILRTISQCFFFLKNVSLLILYFSTNNSIIITKREIRNFYCNFHLLPQFHRNKHLKNTATFTATCWKSPREISNFRPQLSQKRPAKSWGDCIVKWWAHVMSLGKYPARSRAAVLHVKVQRRPRLLLWPKRGRHVSNMLRK